MIQPTRDDPEDRPPGFQEIPPAEPKGDGDRLSQTLSQLLDCISEMVIVQSAERRVVWVNRAACASVGREPAELLGRRCFEVWGDGRGPCEGCVAAKCLTEGKPGMHQVSTPDGQWWESRIYPLPDREGHPQGIIQVSRNVTERMRDETSRLEQERRMMEAQRLESLGRLAGGIAHDFNNLLMGVLGYADLALLHVAPDGDLGRYLQGIRGSAQRLADLTQQMLAYSGKGQFLITDLDLSRLIAELRSLVETSISKMVLLQLELTEPLSRIAGDPRQVRQVLMNLIMNAAESIGERDGIVRVTTREQILDPETLAALCVGEPTPGGRYVAVEVEDTGCGMDEETRRRIFDPFFSTKFTGRGLGLAAVQGIVRGHGGAISVRSAPGRGSSFTVLFPAASQGQAAATLGRPAIHPQGGHETVLLVDDEEAVRDVGRWMLSQAGFQVLLASSGDEAEEIVKSRQGKLDLVILDLCMPRQNGVETLAALRRHRQDLPVILSSGYGESDARAQFGVGEFSGFLHKPYQASQLLQKVREVLDQRGAAGSL